MIHTPSSPNGMQRGCDLTSGSSQFLSSCRIWLGLWAGNSCHRCQNSDSPYPMTLDRDHGYDTIRLKPSRSLKRSASRVDKEHSLHASPCGVIPIWTFISGVWRAPPPKSARH